jgi:hypothetical protein
MADYPCCRILLISRTVVAETGDDREFIPSANFAGVKNGYFYSWGERGAATDATLESVTEGG